MQATQDAHTEALHANAEALNANAEALAMILSELSAIRDNQERTSARLDRLESKAA